MPLQLQSDVRVNSLYWITSLVPEQMGPTNRMVADLEIRFAILRMPFAFIKVSSAQELYDVLNGIVTESVQKGIKPIVQLDMHGCEDGLCVAGANELAPWTRVVQYLQSINMATQCNLVVVAGVCFAFHAIKQVRFNEACPVYLLIAPEKEVSFGFLEANVANFYEDLFSSMDITGAFQRHLSGGMRDFYCEKFLGITLIRYILKGCVGRKKEGRRERLLTDILLDGLPPTPDNLKAVRKMIRNGIKPKQALVDKYAGPFLFGRSCPFTIDDLLCMVENARI